MKERNKLLGRNLDATENIRSYEYIFEKASKTLKLKIHKEIRSIMRNQINTRIETPIMNNVVSLFV